MAVNGPDLYIGGDFTDFAGIPEADHLAHWDGSQWHAVGSDGNGNGALNGRVLSIVFSGGAMYVGGDFDNVGGDPTADDLVMWDGSNWHSFGSKGSNGALSGEVYALAIGDAGMYVGGQFSDAGGEELADNVAFWDGGAWRALGSNGQGYGALNSKVYALAMMGGDLYAGGQFQNAGGHPSADFIARWDGQEWHTLGTEGSTGALYDHVFALTAAGNDLYVGGRFGGAGNLDEADSLARWDGTVWHAVASNGNGNGGLTDSVRAIDVSGNAIFVGGDFTQNLAAYVARWDGTSWDNLGSPAGGDGAFIGSVLAVASDGPRLYAAGQFANLGYDDAMNYVGQYKMSPEATDMEPPVGGVAIDGGNAWAASSAVSVSVAATDVGSGLSKVALSDKPLGPWEVHPYTSAVPWNLGNGDGPKQVYARWEDVAGNWSETSSDSIVLDGSPPVVMKPRFDISIGSTIAAGKVPASLSWSATDAGSGLQNFTLARHINAGAWSNILTGPLGASPSDAQSLSLTIPTATSYFYRTRYADVAGSVSAWANSFAIRLTALQESNSRIHYTGTWSRVTKKSDWAGKAKKSTASGSTATLTFTGHSFAWIARTGPGFGRAEVYVNGVLTDTVDLYAASTTFQRVVWSETWDAATARTVKIKVLGTSNRPAVEVDAFVTAD